MLPTELLLYTMGHLGREDLLLFVLANYEDLAEKGIAPTLTPEIIDGLYETCPSQVSRQPIIRDGVDHPPPSES